MPTAVQAAPAETKEPQPINVVWCNTGKGVSPDRHQEDIRLEMGRDARFMSAVGAIQGRVPGHSL